MRDEDEEDTDIDCPHCGRSFTTFARLDDHMSEHEGPRQCKNCGQLIRRPFHRC